MRRAGLVVVTTVVGVLCYAACIDVFGATPATAGAPLSWLALAAIIVGGVAIWVWHERRGED